MKTTFDITPHPRILGVLGEIEFKPWQCVAELVDNAIDGFLLAKKQGSVISKPLVRVSFGRDKVAVRDNGIGMDVDTLELALKAGWSSQEQFGSLGLYGVGFNIATARLGSKTTMWTTRAGDTEWYGLELDLPQLARGKSFSLEVRTRTKTHPSMSGTEVEVTDIRADWRDLLVSKTWLRGNVTERLGRIYGTMLRKDSPAPIGFSLHVNDQPVIAWEHCVWPADMDVYRKGEGSIRPVQDIDITFGTKYMVVSTGEIHESSEGLNPNDLKELPQRVYGWLGIQRYADEKDYGIDLLRNGRKIEIGCKDLFYWEEELEYPIDEMRYRRGRIVGEIHLDHGYVHYTKHRFEREHLSWHHLLQAVKKNEPLTNRHARMFKGQNNAPLGVLFRTFRRNSPQSGFGNTWKSILFIKDNDKARKWADLFRRGYVEYHEEDLWVKALEESDASPDPSDEKGKGKGKGGTDTDPTPPITTPGDFILDSPSAEPPPVPPAEEPKEERTALATLNMHVTGLGLSGTAYDLEVYAVEGGEPQRRKQPWIGRPTAKGVYEIDVNVNHPVFHALSFRVEDAALSDFAHFITAEEGAKSGALSQSSYGDILSRLRALRSGNDSLESSQLKSDLDRISSHVTAKLTVTIKDGSVISELLDALPQHEREQIELAHAAAVSDASPLEFLKLQHFAKLLRSHAGILFDVGLFKRQWTPVKLSGKPELLARHRERILREVMLPLDVLADFAGMSPEVPTRTHAIFLRASLNKVQELMAVG